MPSDSSTGTVKTVDGVQSSYVKTIPKNTKIIINIITLIKRTFIIKGD